MNEKKNTFPGLEEVGLVPLNTDLFNNLSVEQLEDRLETGCVINYGCSENDGCGANSGEGGGSEEKETIEETPSE